MMRKWFHYWLVVWAGKQGSQKMNFMALFGTKPELLDRCRRAEKMLLKLAQGASTEGAGMGGWVTLPLEERAPTLSKVQTHRLTTSYTDGGANHAQRRRYANMELLLYGMEGCHLRQLEQLTSMLECLNDRAAMVVQSCWRLHSHLSRLAAKGGDHAARKMQLRRRAQVEARARISGASPASPDDIKALAAVARKKAASREEAELNAKGGVEVADDPTETVASGAVPRGATTSQSAAPSNSTGRPDAATAPQPPMPSPAAKPAPPASSSPDVLDRAFLNSMSVGLPEMS